MKNLNYAGYEAVRSRGWLWAHRWLVARRLSQLGILAVFLVGPWYGVWIVKGNLNSSLTLDVLPLTDPYLFMQTVIASFSMTQEMLIGAAIVVLFYILVGGRVYCSWVCPINIVTDIAAWLRVWFNLKGSNAGFSRNTRYWLLGMTLLLALFTGSIAWELVNPVSIFHREIIFSVTTAWLIVAAIFLYDLLIQNNGWCGHLCPVGAFYSLLGKLSVLRIEAADRKHCNDCMDCFTVCPEPQVITQPLKGKDAEISPIILSGNCTNCGRCLDVCSKNVFRFTTRFGSDASAGTTMENTS